MQAGSGGWGGLPQAGGPCSALPGQNAVQDLPVCLGHLRLEVCALGLCAGITLCATRTFAACRLHKAQAIYILQLILLL